MAYVAKLTIDHTKVSADATDFPVYVDLANLNATFWNTVANGGGDIRIYKADGVTELAREVVACDTGTDTGELHFKFTGTLSGSANTVIQIHADGIASDYAVGATYGRNAVWTDYDMVLHMENGVLDSTGNGHARTSGSGETTGSTGKLGKSSDYGGSTSYTFVNGTLTGGATARTMSAWVKSDINTGNWFALAYGNDASGQMFGITSGNTANWWANTYFGDDNSGVAISTANFQKLTFKYTGTQQIFYVDGVLSSTRTRTINTGTGNITIGNYPAQTGTPLNGKIDEIRLRKSAVADSWETTEYNNQNTPATFYTIENVSVNYPMIASIGTFVLTGIANLLKISRKMIASVGTFVLTGIDAILIQGKGMIASVGTFVLTGVDNIFRIALTIIASSGTFVLTGFASALRNGFGLLASLGTFTLTGVDVVFRSGVSMIASVGTFVLTGIDATLLRGKILIADTGAFILTGISVLFSKGLNLIASVGTFALTGIDAILVKGFGIIASVGTFTLTGINNLFRVALSIKATTATFVVTMINVIVKTTGWRLPFDKNNSSATNTDKNTESWINRSKNL